MRECSRYIGLATLLVVLILGGSIARATMVDLTTEGTSGTVNGVIFQQFDPTTSTGTGVIDSFLRIQATGTEQGYNTDGRPLEYDEDNAWTTSLLLSSVPTVTINEIVYREFLLDINQNGQTVLSLDKLQVALGATGNLTGYSTIFSSPIYDLDDGEDSFIKLDYSLNSGSGSGDMLAFIPDSLFTGSNQYVYMYSTFGEVHTGGEQFAADDGFEEWAVGIGGAVTPEPATVLLLGLGALALLRKRT